MHALKLTTIGSSQGFIIPKDVQSRLKVGIVYPTEPPDGSYRLTAQPGIRAADDACRTDHARRPGYPESARVLTWRWTSARVFLADNGYRLQFDPANAVRPMERRAAADLTKDQVATWFRERVAR